MQKQIVQTMLFSYPYLGEFAAACEQAALNKAVLSFKSVSSPEVSAAAVADEIILKRRYLTLETDLKCALEKLTKEEGEAIASRYFKRSAVDMVYSCSVRTLFRRRNTALEKLNFELKNLGWTDALFLRWFCRSPLVRIYKKVVCGRTQKKREAA